MYKTKKTGIATNTIINPKLERKMEQRQKKINKLNTCRKCKNFEKMYCNKFNFRVSNIEIGIKCKNFEKINYRRK